jgi:DNA-binding CsgD family transcriptional regulator
MRHLRVIAVWQADAWMAENAPAVRFAALETAGSAHRYRLRHDEAEAAVLGELLIGRGGDCDVEVEDGLASRRHAKLYVRAQGLMVEDLGSRNGVFVNRQRIHTATALKHGDTVGVGRATFEIVDTIVVRRRDKPTIPAPFAADSSGPDAVTVTPQLGVLTEREREVFELLVLGHTQVEIANQLHLSVKTIESHRARIGEKLGCRTRAELVAYAITAGVLSRPSR